MPYAIDTLHANPIGIVEELPDETRLHWRLGVTALDVADLAAFHRVPAHPRARDGHLDRLRRFAVENDLFERRIPLVYTKHIPRDVPQWLADYVSGIPGEPLNSYDQIEAERLLDFIDASRVLDFAMSLSTNPKSTLARYGGETFAELPAGGYYLEWLAQHRLAYRTKGGRIGDSEALVIDFEGGAIRCRIEGEPMEAATAVSDALFSLHLAHATLCHSGGVQLRRADTLLGEYWIKASDILGEPQTVRACSVCGYPFIVDTSVRNWWKRKACQPCKRWANNQNAGRRKRGVTDEFIDAHPPKRGLYADEYERIPDTIEAHSGI